MNVESGATFEAVYESGITGLVGSLTVRIDDNQNNTVLGPQTTGILEIAGGISGTYSAVLVAPVVEGQYTIVWSNDGSFDADQGIGAEDLLVVAVIGAPTFPPLVPGEQAAGPTPGPCFGWVEAEDVAACCSVVVGSDYDLFEGAASSASQILYMLSGKQFSGSCERVVRPGSDIPCGVQVLARGHVIGWENVPRDLDILKVLLPNYPVTEIVEVKIDGDTLTEDEYRLDGWRWLTRRPDADGNRQYWPGPQREDREDTEDDTFSIRYLFGQNPPQPGIDAAAQLACEIYKACPGNEGVDGDCALPKNAVRVSRQGLTVEMKALTYNAREGWTTGMKLVDAFLNAYNPDGVKQRALIWSPDGPQFAREVGTVMGS